MAKAYQLRIPSCSNSDHLSSPMEAGQPFHRSSDPPFEKAYQLQSPSARHQSSTRMSVPRLNYPHNEEMNEACYIRAETLFARYHPCPPTSLCGSRSTKISFMPTEVFATILWVSSSRPNCSSYKIHMSFVSYRAHICILRHRVLSPVCPPSSYMTINEPKLDQDQTQIEPFSAKHNVVVSQNGRQE